MRALALLLILVITAASAAYAAPPTTGVCAAGYASIGENCVRRLPDNAVANAGDGGWTCKAGFFENGGACQPVRVPANAALSAYGHTWTCNSGYYEAGGKCFGGTPPAPGRGTGTLCGWRYEEEDGNCVAIIPRNARPSTTNAVWTCKPGFQEIDGACAPLRIPHDAHLSAGGDDWLCNFGYQSQNGTCALIDVPRNASLGFYGDVWECNRGFYELRGVCLPETAEHRALVKSTAALFGTRYTAPNLGPAPRIERPIVRIAGINRLYIVMALASFVFGGVVIYFLRPAPRPTRNYKLNYVPRPRGSGLALTWRSFGNRIDALTGASILANEPVHQCRNCRAWYHADSAAALRRENDAKCVACGRVAVSPSPA